MAGLDEGQNHPGESRWKLVLIGFTLVGAFFLLTEHRAHVFGYLPYLLLLACPLMHLFGHGGHGGHGGHETHRQKGGQENGQGPPDAGVPTDNAGPPRYRH